MNNQIEEKAGRKPEIGYHHTQRKRGLPRTQCFSASPAFLFKYRYRKYQNIFLFHKLFDMLQKNSKII